MSRVQSLLKSSRLLKVENSSGADTWSVKSFRHIFYVTLSTLVLIFLMTLLLASDQDCPRSKMKCDTLECLLENNTRKGAANEKVHTIYV